MFKEYFTENNEDVNLSLLKAERLGKEEFITAHKSLPIACHDVFIRYKNGILLLLRDNYPAKNTLWPIGGRIGRGIKTEESLKLKAKEECNLELENIRYVGMARHFWRTEPFGHEKGADTPCLVFFADGFGELNPDKLHKGSKIITQDNFKEVAEDLHPYVKDFLELALKEL